MLDKLFVDIIFAAMIENKTVILIGLGFILYSGLEYFLGNSKHKSLIGLLKFIVKRKNEYK